MRNLLILFLSVFIISGCAEMELASHLFKTTQPSQGSFKVGKPYQIKGVWYRPRETYNFTETGIASWYGPQFHRKQTANGEIFDMNEMTAAHRTLQLPSIVRVTNLENGRSLIVRVNDRGPFARGRIIDLSRKSAELLGFKKQGTAKVKVEVLPTESRQIAELAKRGESTKGSEVAFNEKGLAGRPGRAEISEVELAKVDYRDGVTPDPVEQEVLKSPNFKSKIKNGNIIPEPLVQEVPVPTNTNIFVQAGAFSSSENAKELANMLQKHANAQVYPTFVDGKQFYRVRLGPLENVEVADGLLETLSKEGQPQAVIVVD
ncbi:MAG: septal ring lytic transglycosylase RlpA family protein [Pseudomonadota bacterium]